MSRKSFTTCPNIIVKNFKEVICGQPLDSTDSSCVKCSTEMYYFTKMVNSQQQLKISTQCEQICKITSTVLIDELKAIEESIKEVKKQLKQYNKNGMKVNIENGMRHVRNNINTIAAESGMPDRDLTKEEVIDIALRVMIYRYSTYINSVLTLDNLSKSVFKSLEIATATDNAFKELADLKISSDVLMKNPDE